MYTIIGPGSSNKYVLEVQCNTSCCKYQLRPRVKRWSDFGHFVAV